MVYKEQSILSATCCRQIVEEYYSAVNEDFDFMSNFVPSQKAAEQFVANIQSLRDEETGVLNLKLTPPAVFNIVKNYSSFLDINSLTVMGGSQEQVEYNRILTELVNKIVLAISMEAELPHREVMKSSGIDSYNNFLYKWAGQKGTLKGFMRKRRFLKTGVLALSSVVVGMLGVNLAFTPNLDGDMIRLSLIMCTVGAPGLMMSGALALSPEYDNFWLSKKTKQKWERKTSEEHKEKVLKKFEDNLTVLPMYENGGVFSYNSQPNNLIQND